MHHAGTRRKRTDRVYEVCYHKRDEQRRVRRVRASPAIFSFAYTSDDQAETTILRVISLGLTGEHQSTHACQDENCGH